MTTKMPRGAIPATRNELASAEPYQPDANAKVYVLNGRLPTPSHDLAAARPYKANAVAPNCFVAWPIGIELWEHQRAGVGAWAEEAFAKACGKPRLLISTDMVRSAIQACGETNLSEFMQTRGFRTERLAYLNGPFFSVDWTDAVALHDAIANIGPVKIGIAVAELFDRPITPGASGWAVCGLAAPAEAHWASLCGYGPLPVLIDIFRRHGVEVDPPSGMPADLCYAMFVRGSLGVIDHQSLMNITSEAWVRKPTTIVKPLA